MSDSSDISKIKDSIGKFLSSDDLNDIERLFDSSLVQSDEPDFSYSKFSAGRTQIQKIAHILDSLDKVKTTLEVKVSTLLQDALKKDKLVNELILKKERIISDILLKEKELTRLERSLQFRNEKLKIIDNEIGRLEQKKSQLEESNQKIEARRNDVFKSIELQKQQEESLIERVDNLRILVEGLEKAKYQIEDSIIKIEETLDSSVQNYVKEISSQLNKLNDSRRQTLISDQKLKTKLFEIQERSNLLLFKWQESEKLERDIKSNKIKLGEMEKEQKLLFFRLDKLRDSEKKRILQIRELEHQKDLMHSKFNKIEINLVNILTSIRNEFDMANRNKSEAANEFSKYDKNISELKIEISKAKEDLGLLKESAYQAEKEKDEYTSKISKLISLERTIGDKLGIDIGAANIDEETIEMRSREIIREKEAAISISLIKLNQALRQEEEKYLIAQTHFEDANLLLQQKENELHLRDLRIKSLEATENSFRIKVLKLKEDYESTKMLLDSMKTEIESKKAQLIDLDTESIMFAAQKSDSGSNFKLSDLDDLSELPKMIEHNEQIPYPALPKTDEQQIIDLIRQINRSEDLDFGEEK